MPLLLLRDYLSLAGIFSEALLLPSFNDRGRRSLPSEAFRRDLQNAVWIRHLLRRTEVFLEQFVLQTSSQLRFSRPGVQEFILRVLFLLGELTLHSIRVQANLSPEDIRREASSMAARGAGDDPQTNNNNDHFGISQKHITLVQSLAAPEVTVDPSNGKFMI